MGASKPYVFVITCHDLGRHLGCYGVGERALASPRPPGQPQALGSSTPSAPRPSRASLAASRYPRSHEVMGLTHGGFDWDLHPQERHAAAQLAAYGYETHVFGLQHVTQGTVDGGDIEFPAGRAEWPHRATAWPSTGAPARRAAALVPLANDR